jgi:hypothetical protein
LSVPSFLGKPFGGRAPDNEGDDGRGKPACLVITLISARISDSGGEVYAAADLPFFPLFAFFASISTFFTMPDFINVS